LVSSPIDPPGGCCPRTRSRSAESWRCTPRPPSSSTQSNCRPCTLPPWSTCAWRALEENFCGRPPTQTFNLLLVFLAGVLPLPLPPRSLRKRTPRLLKLWLPHSTSLACRVRSALAPLAALAFTLPWAEASPSLPAPHLLKMATAWVEGARAQAGALRNHLSWCVRLIIISCQSTKKNSLFMPLVPCGITLKESLEFGRSAVFWPRKWNGTRGSSTES